VKTYFVARRKVLASVISAVLLCLVCPVTPASAKRAAPIQVKPVVKDGIEYSAPLSREGFVVATWIKTGREIWSRQIYAIKHEYKQGLEEDVQTCFITELQFYSRKLKVTNEQGGEFEVDPDTLTVTVLKGKRVIDYTSFKPGG
jgi:hypothetical protein